MRPGRTLWSSIYVRRRWLTPGIGIKRWLLLLVLGAGVMGLGMLALLQWLSGQGWFPESLTNLLTLQFLPEPLRIILPLALGGGMTLWAVFKIGRNLVAPLRPGEGAVVDSLVAHRRRGRGARVVAIGGGTGMPSLLRGLIPYTSNITAIVTVADDGGSSGRLRRGLGLLPPGDFRNNLAALARDETLMTQVLQYRFGALPDQNGQSELQGHSFGNLLLAALTGITGSFDEALVAAQRVLALSGQVLPSTMDQVTLLADITVAGPDGPITKEVKGESAIPESGGVINQVWLQPDNPSAYPAALKEILRADLIVLGPGSLYTSIMPNLLVDDLAQALRYTDGRVAYICNIATQPGETDGYSVSDHVIALQQHVQGDWLDVVVANNNLSVPTDAGGGKTEFVRLDTPPNVDQVVADLVDEEHPWRHDSTKLGAVVMGLVS